MRKNIYIFLTAILLFTSCKEPNIAEPDTERDIKDIVEYQVIDQTEFGFDSEVFAELVIRDEQELKNNITKYSSADNLDLVDKLLSVNLENNLLVVISGKTMSVKASISIDTIYLDNNGHIQIDYIVNRKIGINSRLSAPTLVILIKNRKNSIVNFSKRFEDDGFTPNIDGFVTIAENVTTDTRGNWKTVFNTEAEFELWANANSLDDMSFISKVDFDTELVISVGSNRFQSGIHNYRITDVNQQGGRIIVNSTFVMTNASFTPNKKSNHFVKIRKTGLPIYFTPTVVINNVFTGGKFYNEEYRMISIEASEKTDASIVKVSNLSELFSVFSPSIELSPSNVEVDWEFFDLLIVKAPTTNYKGLKYELDYLKRDDFGIIGKLIVLPDNSDLTKQYDNYIFLKILKTNIPISKNFEVLVK